MADFIGLRKEEYWLIQRQTNREERKVDEWEDYSETDCLRTTDATRKEEKIGWGEYDAITKRNIRGETKYKQICE